MKLLMITPFIMILIACGNQESEGQYLERVRGIIGAPVDFKPQGRIEGGLKDFSFHKDGVDVKRISVNLVYPIRVSNEDADKEIRYFMYNIWSEHRDVKVISVKCFEENEDLAFKTGTFAPFGDITRADAQVRIEFFEVNI